MKDRIRVGFRLRQNFESKRPRASSGSFARPTLPSAVPPPHLLPLSICGMWPGEKMIDVWRPTDVDLTLELLRTSKTFAWRSMLADTRFSSGNLARASSESDSICAAQARNVTERESSTIANLGMQFSQPPQRLMSEQSTLTHSTKRRFRVTAPKVVPLFQSSTPS